MFCAELRIFLERVSFRFSNLDFFFQASAKDEKKKNFDKRRVSEFLKTIKVEQRTENRL